MKNNWACHESTQFQNVRHGRSLQLPAIFRTACIMVMISLVVRQLRLGYAATRLLDAAAQSLRLLLAVSLPGIWDDPGDSVFFH